MGINEYVAKTLTEYFEEFDYSIEIDENGGRYAILSVPSYSEFLEQVGIFIEDFEPADPDDESEINVKEDWLVRQLGAILSNLGTENLRVVNDLDSRTIKIY